MKTTMTPRALLGLESLERRDLLAGISLTAATGQLVIDGGNYNDSATVWRVGTQVKATLSTRVGGMLLGTPVTKTYSAASVKSVLFRGFNGDDSFLNSSAVTSTAIGGNGHDTLRGGAGADFLVGNAGDDKLHGNGGGDYLYGGGAT